VVPVGDRYCSAGSADPAACSSAEPQAARLAAPAADQVADRSYCLRVDSGSPADSWDVEFPVQGSPGFHVVLLPGSRYSANQVAAADHFVTLETGLSLGGFDLDAPEPPQSCDLATDASEAPALAVPQQGLRRVWQRFACPAD
jgi:hypothetical protein